MNKVSHFSFLCRARNSCRSSLWRSDFSKYFFPSTVTIGSYFEPCLCNSRIREKLILAKNPKAVKVSLSNVLYCIFCAVHILKSTSNQIIRKKRFGGLLQINFCQIMIFRADLFSLKIVKSVKINMVSEPGRLRILSGLQMCVYYIFINFTCTCSLCCA